MKLKRYVVCTKPSPVDGTVNGPGAESTPAGWMHWCPACNEVHAIAVEKPLANGAKWTFDGNMDAPTFNPSINIRIGPYPTVPKGRKDAGKVVVCHYHIHGGKIIYCGDCTHRLKGQTVPLPDLPEGT